MSKLTDSQLIAVYDTKDGSNRIYIKEAVENDKYRLLYNNISSISTNNSYGNGRLNLLYFKDDRMKLLGDEDNFKTIFRDAFYNLKQLVTTFYLNSNNFVIKQ